MSASLSTWTTDEFRAAGYYVVHLINCALNNTSARPLPTTTTWQQVYALSQFNSVEALVWFGVRTRDDVPQDIAARFEQDAHDNLYRMLHFEVEREQILAAMEEKGLSYLLLKGILAAPRYPHPEMRFMADNDILYGFVEPNPAGGYRIRGKNEEEQFATVREAMRVMCHIMEARGYEAESLAKGSHDSFMKPPLYNFEMHRTLMSPDRAVLYAYYENPWARAVQSSENPHEFSWSPEDVYIYEVAHAFKHFDASGCGIRCAVDAYVFLQANDDLLDWCYIEGELERMKLGQFEARLRATALAAFAPDALPLRADQEEFLLFLMQCGTYGSMQTRVERKVAALKNEAALNHDGSTTSAQAVKRRYLRDRILPNEDFLKTYYPFFYRHRALRFLVLPIRLCKAVGKSRKVLDELKALRNITFKE